MFYRRKHQEETSFEWCSFDLLNTCFYLNFEVLLSSIITTLSCTFLAIFSLGIIIFQLFLKYEVFVILWIWCEFWICSFFCSRSWPLSLYRERFLGLNSFTELGICSLGIINFLVFLKYGHLLGIKYCLLFYGYHVNFEFTFFSSSVFSLFTWFRIIQRPVDTWK